MDTQDIVEMWRDEGRVIGVLEGRAQGVKQVLIWLLEARFSAMPDDILATINGTYDEVVLRAWVKLAATRSADETTAAIRARRAR